MTPLHVHVTKPFLLNERKESAYENVNYLGRMIFENNYCLWFTFFSNIVFQVERAVKKKSSSVYLNHDIDSSPVMAERLYISDSAPDKGSRNSLRGSIVQVWNDLIMKIS